VEWVHAAAMTIAAAPVQRTARMSVELWRKGLVSAANVLQALTTRKALEGCALLAAAGWWPTAAGYCRVLLAAAISPTSPPGTAGYQ